MEFLFTTEQTYNRADELVDYLRGPRLWIPRTDYPDYDRWLLKVHRQLKSEEKRAIMALRGDEIIGSVVYQRHPELADVLEVRTISVAPDARGRHVASFLMRNAEIEGHADFNTSAVVVDAKAKNTGIRHLMQHCGYESLGPRDLYSLGAGEDVLFLKSQRYVDTRKL